MKNNLFIFAMESTQKTIQNKESFLKYEDPKLVISKDRGDLKKDFENALKFEGVSRKFSEFENLCYDLSSLKEESNIGIILDQIFPPNEWEDNKGRLWHQKVSRSVPSRKETGELGEILDQRLENCQSRSKSVCPIRRNFLEQLFDELIRQVTLICPERGFMLSRVRDELKMNMASYNSLFEVSQKFTGPELGEVSYEKKSLEKKTNRIDFELKERIELISMLKLKKEQVERKWRELLKNEENNYLKEIELLANAKVQIKKQIDIITTEDPKTIHTKARANILHIKYQNKE